MNLAWITLIAALVAGASGGISQSPGSRAELQWHLNSDDGPPACVELLPHGFEQGWRAWYSFWHGETFPMPDDEVAGRQAVRLSLGPGRDRHAWLQYQAIPRINPEVVQSVTLSYRLGVQTTPRGPGTLSVQFLPADMRACQADPGCLDHHLFRHADEVSPGWTRVVHDVTRSTTSETWQDGWKLAFVARGDFGTSTWFVDSVSILTCLKPGALADWVKATPRPGGAAGSFPPPFFINPPTRPTPTHSTASRS